MPSVSSAPSLSPLQALKQYFGHDAFRPGQNDIIEQALAGRDLLVLMPTGGGKSLCYQLPALLAPGVTLVISPLIALMQDQVMGLQDNGIAATFLNSTLSIAELRSREATLLRGDIDLLYIAPERLLQSEFWPTIEALQKKVGITRIAVDEAHCVSEWGHDFRPEYRQLLAVREKLPGVPVTALTATATERVQADIVQQLGLHDAYEHVSSFNRENLYYAVLPKPKRSLPALVQLIREQRGGSTVVYCQSRATVDKVAAYLQAEGIQALPYHAGMSGEEREAHQTNFVRDNVQAIVATIAFGMGIDKPDVRLVVHFDLPRNLEGYYQESGRAGRDGLPAQCVMFFNHGDRAKIEFLIKQKSDLQEQRIARQQLRQVIDFASTFVCRRRVLLNYFGEATGLEPCQNCDNCCHPVDLEDRTIEAQKFLSCVYRCEQKYGMKYIIDVLRGKEDDRIRRNHHDELSTFGIGRDLSQKAWQSLGQALLHQEFLIESTDGYGVLSVSNRGISVLKKELTVEVPPLKSQASESLAAAKTNDLEDITPFQADLFQHLRQLRKHIADRQSVPPYIIFSDRTLRAMAASQPQSLLEFSELPGVGDKKLKQYGDRFLHAIQSFVSSGAPDVAAALPDAELSAETTEPQDSAPPVASSAIAPESAPMEPEMSLFATKTTSTFAAKTASTAEPAPSVLDRLLGQTYLDTLALHQQGLTVEAIAKQRELTPKTIYTHLVHLLAAGEAVNIDALVSPERQRQIFRAFYDLHSYASLTPVREYLGEGFSYEEIRLVRVAIFGRD
ncbi:MAG: DNA helicase RecQ [Cyanobacteria bacterium J06642_2]